MAISAQTSRTLHDTLGEAAANDLSKWMSEVESGRSELRELSEMQIRRFSEQSEMQVRRFSEQSRRWIGKRCAPRRIRLRIAHTS